MNPNMRALKVTVVVMGVLLVMGTIALVVAVVAKINHRLPSLSTAPAPVMRMNDVALPARARIVATKINSGRLVVRVALADGGEEILIFDLATGARTTMIMLQPKPGAR